MECLKLMLLILLYFLELWCASNQCEVDAGFLQIGAKKVAHFFKTTSLNAVTKQCDTVKMKSPTTKFFDVEDSSCYPKNMMEML
uniref:Uncharacterized protein n=1 Tax=Panagrolaimus superbus TaxID=310955 RepID=A0A914YJ16_9BILA